MQMKYIVMTAHHKLFGEHEVPILFPQIVAHKTMADGARDSCFAGYDDDLRFDPKPIAAGFVTLRNDKLVCFGESESLGGIVSRGEVDAQLIANCTSSIHSTVKRDKEPA